MLLLYRGVFVVVISCMVVGGSNHLLSGCGYFLDGCSSYLLSGCPKIGGF
jgi:hypothetical protein